MKFAISLLVATLCLGLSATAQKQHDTIWVKKTNTSIKIDGSLDEAWSQAAVAKDFWQYFPMDTSLAWNPTEVRLLYDDQFVYYLAIAK